MKLKTYRFFGALMLGFSMVSGCYAGPTVRRDYVVYQDPYPQGPVWSSGYWRWSGNHWLWIDGMWLAPRPGYVYMQPVWVRRGSRWTFTHGYWRRGRVYRRPRYVPVYRQPVRHPRATVYRNDFDQGYPSHRYRYSTRPGWGKTYHQPYPHFPPARRGPRIAPSYHSRPAPSVYRDRGFQRGPGRVPMHSPSRPPMRMPRR